jgi:dTDP-glucose 4,6-dehydratase
MRVLLTGHGGFVGHHILQYLLENTDWKFVCIDSFRHKGTVRRVVEVGEEYAKRFTTVKHDLTVPFDPQLENVLFGKMIDPFTGFVHWRPIDAIINVASDSAVERSASDPTACLKNNYDLMLNMLEFARKYEIKAFYHISTDEVYGEAFGNHCHKEWEPMMPSNPYAASKAAQEMMAFSYWRTYNMPIMILNIMNIIGERQDHEKFLPKIIEKVAKGEEMPIYGDARCIGTRCYLHARNVADAILFLSQSRIRRYTDAMFSSNPNDYLPDKYHICGEQEVNNLEFAQMVAKLMPFGNFKYKMVPSESARPGYDRRYMLDGTKLRNLGWKPPMTLQESLKRVVDWTVKNPHWLI